ncbi:hypothetical protein [Mesobacillus harenae]|uniref:hypothetical protein n=1 Tax=Mesobacillus harenae TaxID=2213203 RepID=UPI0015801A56|nr:hypothetical protein [Mesobacillus harenae]
MKFAEFLGGGARQYEKRSRLSRNEQTGNSDKEAVCASVGGIEVCRVSRTRSWTKKSGSALNSSDKRWRA